MTLDLTDLFEEETIPKEFEDLSFFYVEDIKDLEKAERIADPDELRAGNYDIHFEMHLEIDPVAMNVPHNSIKKITAERFGDYSDVRRAYITPTRQRFG
jgi:hypothetical protein